MKGPVNDLRVQSGGKSIQCGINEKDLMRAVGFELVLLDEESLGKWGYDRGLCLIGGIAAKGV